MRVVVAGLKGGVGKTTTSVYLAECAHREAPTLLIDIDPQESAYSWLSSDSYGEVGPTVARISSSVHQEVERLAGTFAHVVIDTAPGMAERQLVQDVMLTADIVVMPLAPSLVEVDRVAPTFLLAQIARRPAVALLVKGRKTRLMREMVEALELYKVPLLETTIPLRTALEGGFGYRPTELYGYAEVWEELKEITEGLRYGG